MQLDLPHVARPAARHDPNHSRDHNAIQQHVVASGCQLLDGVGHGFTCKLSVGRWVGKPPIRPRPGLSEAGARALSWRWRLYREADLPDPCWTYRTVAASNDAHRLK